jgi:hypothetical protein
VRFPPRPSLLCYAPLIPATRVASLVADYVFRFIPYIASLPPQPGDYATQLVGLQTETPARLPHRAVGRDRSPGAQCAALPTFAIIASVRSGPADNWRL